MADARVHPSNAEARPKIYANPFPSVGTSQAEAAGAANAQRAPYGGGLDARGIAYAAGKAKVEQQKLSKKK